MTKRLSLFLLLAAYTAFAQSGGMVNGSRGFPVPNDSTTGTTLNSTAIIDSAGQAILAGTSNTSVPTYVVMGGAGTSGNANLAVYGLAPCTMDATVSSAAGGYYVVNSTTTAGDCHPQSAAPASGTWVIGYLAASSTSSGSTALVAVDGFVYGQPGYAPLVSPTFTGTPAAPTPATNDNSTALTNTAWVRNQGYGTASGLAAGNYPKANGTAGITDSGVTAGPYSTFWALPGSVSTSSPIACSGTANKATIWGVSIPFPIKTSNVAYYVVGADNTTNTYDLGLYNISGNLIAHTGMLAGTTFAPTASHYTSQPWTTANTVLQPGTYWLALTCSAISGTATFGYAYTWVNAGNTSENLTTGGALPSSVTVPGSSSFTNASTLQVVFF
jgi:hypothetical protein